MSQGLYKTGIFGNGEGVIPYDPRLKKEDGNKSIVDKYGNVFIVSPDNLVYHSSKEVGPRQASIAITSYGRKTIMSFPGLLKNISRGLETVVNTIEPGTFKTPSKFEFEQRIKEKDIPVVSSLQKYDTGRQSRVFLLEIPGYSKMIVKVAAQKRKIEHDYPTNNGQPYIDELLQYQELTERFGNLLEANSIKFPTVFFASGQVMCQEYYHGRHPTPEELVDNNAGAVVNELDQYIIGSESYLWKNIQLDTLPWYNKLGDTVKIPKPDNLVVPYGNSDLVWVDPFLNYS